MKVKELRDLIDFISKSGLNEVSIETEEFKIEVKRDAQVKQVIESPAPVAVSVPPANPTPSAAPTPPAQEPGGENGAPSGSQLEIKSPMIGTFYRSSNPETPAFIEVGDKVTAGQTVCIVEAMKLFNEIESEISGTVVKVLVENSTPVEYDQPLFLVEPS